MSDLANVELYSGRGASLYGRIPEDDLRRELTRAGSVWGLLDLTINAGEVFALYGHIEYVNEAQVHPESEPRPDAQSPVVGARAPRR
jgi:hypothetical protein